MATPNIQNLGQLALPVLVDCAQKREIITYGDLTRRIGASNPRIMGHVLGHLRDDICHPRDLPLINAIVVRKADHLPGDAFLPEGTGHLDAEDYLTEFERFRDGVFKYPHWDELLRELGLDPVEKTPADLAEEARQHLDVQRRQGGTGEGDRHRDLKAFIATRPDLLDIPPDAAVTIEEELLSGDRCDVVFRWEGQAAVVEVKRGERGELMQGIYQAIKYRAVLTAQEGEGGPFPVAVHLVAYAVPPDIVGFARRFDINCLLVELDEVQEEA